MAKTRTIDGTAVSFYDKTERGLRSVGYRFTFDSQEYGAHTIVSAADDTTVSKAHMTRHATARIQQLQALAII